jgi:hypothetical protein
MKMTVDAIRDHIVPIISKRDTTYHIFKSLEDTYGINNTDRALTLKRQLHHVKVNKEEILTTYFEDHLIERPTFYNCHQNGNKELTLTTLGGLPSSWESFIQRVCTFKSL